MILPALRGLLQVTLMFNREIKLSLNTVKLRNSVFVNIHTGANLFQFSIAWMSLCLLQDRIYANALNAEYTLYTDVDELPQWIMPKGQ